MTREELIERIENANKTPIEVDDMWINMVYTVYPNFSSDMLLAAKRATVYIPSAVPAMELVIERMD